MATVLTTFTTAGGIITPSEFRSVNPKRCKLTTVNLSAELRDKYSLSDGQQLEIAFPFGPRDMRFSNQATTMDQISRPGKKPLLEKRNDPLRQIAFNAVISSTATAAGGRRDIMSGTTPVDDAMETIERIAQSGATCKFVYGTVALGYFVSLSRFDFTVQYRDAEGHPTRVKAEFQLTEKPTFVQELSNLPVIPNDPPPSDPPKPSTPTEDDEYLEVLTQYTDETTADFIVNKVSESRGTLDKETGEYVGGTGERIDKNVWESVGLINLYQLPGFPTAREGVFDTILPPDNTPP